MISLVTIFRVQTSGTVAQMSHPSGPRENRFSTLRQLLPATTIHHQRPTLRLTNHNLISTCYSRNSLGKPFCSRINKFVILVCTMNVKSSFVDIFNVSHIVGGPTAFDPIAVLFMIIRMACWWRIINFYVHFFIVVVELMILNCGWRKTAALINS